MELRASWQIRKYNQLYKELDEIYHDTATAMGISYSTMMMLYSLHYIGRPCTQHEICELWSLKKQTVRTVLNSLVSKRYVVLEPLKENPHIKYIILTENGQELVQETVVPLIEAEEAAFAMFTEQEQDLFLELMEKHLGYFRKTTEKLRNSESK